MSFDRRGMGWAPVWRCIEQSSTWRGADQATRMLMVAIICSIRHRRGSDGVPAGATDWTVERFAEFTAGSPRNVKRGLAYLVTCGWIERTRKSNRPLTLVPDWRKWMVSGVPEGKQQRAMVAPATGQVGPPLINEEGEEDLKSPVCDEHEPPDLLRTDEGQGGPVVIPVDDPGRRAELEGYKRVLDDFFKRYRAANEGRSPIWGAREGAQLKSLLKHAGHEDVLHRMGVMFERPPRWLEPPYTWGTFVRNFDALTGATGGRVTAAALVERARNERSQGR